MKKYNFMVIKTRLKRWKERNFKSKADLCKTCKKYNCFKMKLVNFLGIACLINSKCYEPEWESKYDVEPIPHK